ncbi:HAMP domain-containing sensor histidine kinase [Massilia sp. YIM B02769]|uniref:sensor histidine kinase n=1 Tax=Massilia sp. YIM B02769 TaxID=3050129 RepID=UPI0025B67B1E|nr:HAMP domain-containing sensor histidine kinase [Massilia sp. YIM B02769]MDN4059734.1 HAMP domain-containing sensor histidine kinase [Massilia sp. YIM B02769]
MDDTQHSQQLALFLASTAHDMKNSISVLSGTLERLLDGASPQTETAYPQMAQMLYQTRRLNDNLMQLLALYKQVGQPEYPFDVQAIPMVELAEQVAALGRVLLQSRGIAFEVEVDTDLIWHLDEDLIVGVVSHAVNNAVNYTRDRIRLALRQEGDLLEIRVEDNGDGYPQALLDAGAEAMSGVASGVDFRTNSAGLGLYFAREVARMHRHRGRHGAVRLENGGRLGGGCFILTMP